MPNYRRIGYGPNSSIRTWTEMAGQGYRVFNAAKNLYYKARPYYKQAQGLYQDYQSHRARQSFSREKKFNSNRDISTLASSNNMGYSSVAGGHYGGKIKAKKRVKQTKFLKLEFESQGTLSDYRCVYISHNTFSIYRAHHSMSLALMRALLNKAGYDTNADGSFGQYISGILLVEYRTVPTGIPLSATYATYLGASLTSLDKMADDFVTWCHTIWTSSPNALITSIRLVPTADSGTPTVSTAGTSINLSTAKFIWNVKSELKVQNATLATTTGGSDEDDANAVDAPPLQGTLYKGVGQGPIPKDRDNDAPILYESGAISETTNADGVHPVGATIFDPYAEPINPEQLVGVKKHSKVVFQPGEMKKSVIYDSSVMSCSSFLNVIGRVYSNIYWVTPKHAKFEMLGLEKMIGLFSGVSSDQTPVRVQWQCDQYWNVYVKVHNETSPPHYVKKYTDVNITA